MGVFLPAKTVSAFVNRWYFCYFFDKMRATTIH